MKKAVEILSGEGLAFFGRINASISHELKNIMATISETSGLMGDLLELAEKGRELDSKALKSCSEGIEDEIRRGFTAIKQMNAFAHSVDEMVKEVDIHEILDLVVNLSQFLSFASHVHFDRTEGVGLKVSTCPFLLEDLLYQALTTAYKLVGPSGEIRISVRGDDQGVGIRLSGDAMLGSMKFPDENASKIADVLGAEVLSPVSGKECHIRLSYYIEDV
jgi:signal transduction histidine kinase